MREFVFGSESDGERDAWITSIMYLRTQAIQTDFNRKFHFLPPPPVRRDLASPRSELSTISFNTSGNKRMSRFVGHGGEKRFSFIR